MSSDLSQNPKNQACSYYIRDERPFLPVEVCNCWLLSIRLHPFRYLLLHPHPHRCYKSATSSVDNIDNERTNIIIAQKRGWDKSYILPHRSPPKSSREGTWMLVKRVSTHCQKMPARSIWLSPSTKETRCTRSQELSLPWIRQTTAKEINSAPMVLYFWERALCIAISRLSKFLKQFSSCSRPNINLIFELHRPCLSRFN